MRQPENVLEIDSPLPVRACLGVIDVGSNAIRVQVARVFQDGSFAVVHDEREPVRLGEEVFRTGVLSTEAIRQALDTLGRYASTARKHGALRVRAVATCAVREAANGDAFTREVEKATGLRLEIISGTEEAKLIARGVLSGLEPTAERLALADIGGGSTEISLVENGEVRFGVSVPLGSVRMTEMFCLSDPLLPGHERAMREHVRACLAQTLPTELFGSWGRIIGSAGTIGALANFIRRRPSTPRSPRAGPQHLRTSFTVRELARASVSLRKMSLARRRKTPGIEERRAEIIVAGAVILEELAAHLKSRTIKIVRRGLRDGLMLEEIERFAALQPGAPMLLGPPVRVSKPRR
ncbi:MAG: exopolyphosphatase [Deltaproteobacteria bacterium]|nr:exopolyphosphatase [Deltaproteobacteria bacterium]